MHVGWRLPLPWSLLRRGRRRTTDALGREGERAAVRALRRAGYVVLARRHRAGGAEVDVVALDGGTLVLVEVKATAGAADVLARRVGARKVRRLRAAWRALARYPRLARLPRRLDVVEVRFLGGRAQCRLRRGHASL